MKYCKEIQDQLDHYQDLIDNPIFCTECSKVLYPNENKICWSCEQYLEDVKNGLFDEMIDDAEDDLPVCGNKECGCSSLLDGRMSFGSGKLDFCGYWEIPCRICAEDFDKKHADKQYDEGDWRSLPAWPFE